MPPEKTTTGPIAAIQKAQTILVRKSSDYQNKKSKIVQADYYPRGVLSILDIIHTKYLRATSLLEAAQEAEARGEDRLTPNYESLEDTFLDMINYAAFAAAWCAGEIDGQDPRTGLFSNKWVPVSADAVSPGGYSAKYPALKDAE